MTSYTAHFRSDAGFAIQEIRASTPQRALKAARKLADEDPKGLNFRPYEAEFSINEIVISDAYDEEEFVVWYDADLKVRLAASDLLAAAQRVLERWKRGDLAEAVRELAAAVAKAKGGAS